MTTPTSPPDRLMCRGGCGYQLRSELSRARGFGHRCWDKLPRTTQDAITATIPKRRPARLRIPGPIFTCGPNPADGQLPITPETTEDDIPVHAGEFDEHGQPTGHALCGGDGKIALSTWRITCEACLGWADRHPTTDSEA